MLMKYNLGFWFSCLVSITYLPLNKGLFWHRLASEHEQELQALQRCQEQEMARLRGELEQQRQLLVSSNYF
jgi:hypothetical protein